MTDATENMAGLHSHSSEFDFRFYHRSGIKPQVVVGTFGLSTTKVDKFQVEDTGPVLMVTESRAESKKLEVGPNFMHGIAFNDGMKTVTPGHPEDSQESDGKANEKPLETRDILTAKLIHPKCKESATSLYIPLFVYSLDRQGVHFRHSKVNGSVQKVVPASSSTQGI